jgi:hypothetical protein
MKTKKKSFDCVEMMHEAALRVYEETQDMSREEELAWWEQKNREMLERYPQFKEKKGSSTPADW